MKPTKDDKVQGAYFSEIGDDGFGLFLSFNHKEAEDKFNQILINQAIVDNLRRQLSIYSKLAADEPEDYKEAYVDFLWCLGAEMKVSS